MHMHLPIKKVNLITSTPWLLQSWAIYLIPYFFNKSRLIEHTRMLKLINCWTWICINIYMLNRKLFTKAHLKLIETKHSVFLHIFIRSTCRLLKCNIKSVHTSSIILWIKSSGIMKILQSILNQDKPL